MTRGSGRPTVFATVGTDHHPFDRMVDWIEEWLAQEPDRADCFIQYGTSRRPNVAGGEALIPHDEMDRRVAGARAIVCHGGPGTISDCLRAGVKPIVLPRRHSLGEHVDDHQRRFARRLEEAGYIKVAETREAFDRLLDAALAGSPEFTVASRDDAIGSSIRRFDELTAPLIRSRNEGLRVIYIGGWGRSGSTLLDRLLGQVPGTCSVGEMRDLWLRGVLEDRRCGCGEAFHACPFWKEVGSRAFGGWSRVHAEEMHRLRMRFDRPWTTPLLASRVRWPRSLDRYVETTAALYRSIASVSGARTIIDSTKIPSYAFLIHRIPDIDLRFVHLVRDSRGVIHSWQKAVDRHDSTAAPDRMLRYGTIAASGRYLLYNATADLVRLSRIPYQLVRYEDLSSNPGSVLTRIASFGDLPIEGIDFLDGDAATLPASHTVDGNPMRFATGRVEIRTDEAWRRQMTERDRRLVTLVTAPLLHRYGYPSGSDPDPR